MGHVVAHFAGEIEHALKCRVTELAAHDGGVFLRVRRVQADGHRVHDARKLRRNVASVDKTALAVGVHAHRQVVAALHLGGHALEHVKCAGRFAVAAKHHFFVAAHVLSVEGGHNLFERGLMVEPQVVFAAFAVASHAISGLTDAERTRAAAAVRQVHVQPVVHGVHDSFGFRFGHSGCLLSSCMFATDCTVLQ